MKETVALDYLCRDSVFHMNMVFAIRRKTANLMYADNESVLLQETRSGAYMLSASRKEKGEKLLDLVPAGALWVAHQQYLVKPIQQKYRLLNIYPCHQAVYLGNTIRKVAGDLCIRELDPTYVHRIAQQYHLVGEEEIRNVIEHHELFGGFLGREWAGFGGFHAEGSIGMLEIFPQYRRRGYAMQMESFLMNRILEQGRTPFAQIFPDNVQSIRLHEKLGFTISDALLYWLD